MRKKFVVIIFVNEGSFDLVFREKGKKLRVLRKVF